MDETNTSEREQSRYNRRSVLRATGVAVVSGALVTGSATAQLPDEVPNSTTETYEESLEQAEATENVADEYDFESPDQPENPADDVSDGEATEYDSEEVSQTVTNESVEITNVTSDNETAAAEDVTTDPADTSSSVSDELAALSELEFDFW